MTKTNKINLFLLLLLIVGGQFMFISCSDDEDNKSNNNSYQQGLYVLCEGLMGYNNATLDFYDTKDNIITKDIFSLVNAQGLGETANDMIRVAENIWIVNSTGSLAVIDRKTCRLLQVIPIVDSNGTARQPRHLVYTGDNVYVSCFDGNVVKVNSHNYQIEAICSTQGRNPDGLALANNKLYVANSGGLSYPNYDNSVSVIRLSDFTLVKKIDVHSNPTIVRAHDNMVYVLSFGDYSGLPMLTEISTAIDMATDSLQIGMTDFDFAPNGDIYYFYSDFQTGAKTLKYRNSIHATPNDFIDMPETLVSPYHIIVINNRVFVTDSKDYSTSGAVFVFDRQGRMSYSFDCGINPNKVLER